MHGNSSLCLLTLKLSCGSVRIARSLVGEAPYLLLALVQTCSCCPGQFSEVCIGKGKESTDCPCCHHIPFLNLLPGMPGLKHLANTVHASHLFLISELQDMSTWEHVLYPPLGVSYSQVWLCSLSAFCSSFLLLLAGCPGPFGFPTTMLWTWPTPVVFKVELGTLLGGGCHNFRSRGCKRMESATLEPGTGHSKSH